MICYYDFFFQKQSKFSMKILEVNVSVLFISGLYADKRWLTCFIRASLYMHFISMNKAYKVKC